MRILKNNYPIHLIIGLVSLLTGLELWLSRTYFFWPPHYASLLNDGVVGFIGVISGISIILWTYYPERTKGTHTVIMTVLAGYMAFLTCVELGHVLFAGYPRMVGDVVTDVAVMLLIYYCSSHTIY